MIRIKTYNELFGFGSMPYDDLCNRFFKELVDNIHNIKVGKFSDYRREATIARNSKNINEDREYKTKRIDFNHKIEDINSNQKSKDIFKINNNTKVEVVKNYSKHRFGSKVLGSVNQNIYSLSINGKHFVSDVRGKEGKSLVSLNIVKKYWDFLSDVSTLQENLKKKLISKYQYEFELDRIKLKYLKM